MRQRRLKIEDGVYHVTFRVRNKEFLLNDKEKYILLNYIKRSATFSGVDILEYAIMDNHVHLMIHVDKKRELSNTEVIDRISHLYTPEKFAEKKELWDVWSELGLDFNLEQELNKFRKRMFDLSECIKTIKESYTMSYNYRHNADGTLWKGRFYSVVLEKSYSTLIGVATYIGLNPFRAGIVEDYHQTRWTQYGAALRGDENARRGIIKLVAMSYGKESVTWEEAYEVMEKAYAGGISCDFKDGKGSKIRNHNIALIMAKLEGKEDLDFYEYARCRVPGMSRGLVLGSAEFIEEMRAIALFNGIKVPKRECKVEGCKDLDLQTLSRIKNRSISLNRQ